MRHIGTALFLALSVAACSTGGPAQTAGPRGTGSGQTVAPGATAGGGGGGGILAAAQAAAAHPCGLLPTDLVATIVPSPAPPQEELFPPGCTVFGDKVAIAFSLDPTSKLEKPAGSEDVSGFPNGAYLEKLSTGNWTLWVPMTADLGYIFAEVNNQDGKDHQGEVVDLAKGILQRLGG